MDISAISFTVIRALSALLGIFDIVLGIQTLFKPAGYPELFGFTSTSSTTSTGTSNPFIPAVASRNISSGLVLVGCVYLKSDKALGVVMLGSAVQGLIDGFIVRRHAEPEKENKEAAKKKAWMHWTGVPVVIAVGVWLLLYSEP